MMESGFQDKTFKELLRADVQKCVVPLVCCREAFSISFPAVVVMNHVLAFLACFGMFWHVSISFNVYFSDELLSTRNDFQAMHLGLS